MLPVHPVPPVAPLSPDSIVESAQGGSFLLQSAEQFVTLLKEQRRMFSAIFFKKTLQDLATRKSKDEADAKEYKTAKDSMRKNELRIQKDKIKNCCMTSGLLRFCSR